MDKLTQKAQEVASRANQARIEIGTPNRARTSYASSVSADEIHALREAAQLAFTENGEYWLNRGRNWDEAFEDFRNAIHVNANDLSVLWDAGAMLLGSDRTEELLAYKQKSDQLQSMYSRAYRAQSDDQRRQAEQRKATWEANNKNADFADTAEFHAREFLTTLGEYLQNPVLLSTAMMENSLDIVAGFLAGKPLVAMGTMAAKQGVKHLLKNQVKDVATDAAQAAVMKKTAELAAAGIGKGKLKGLTADEAKDVLTRHAANKAARSQYKTGLAVAAGVERGVGAAQEIGTSAAGTYNQALDFLAEQAYNDAINNGATPEQAAAMAEVARNSDEAREQATEAARITTGMVAPLSLATEWAGGKMGADIAKDILTRQGLVSTPKMVGGIAQKIGASGFQETVQEGGSTVAGNIGIQQTVDPTQAWTENLGTSAGAGAAIGGGLSANLNAPSFVIGNVVRQGLKNAEDRAAKQVEEVKNLLADSRTAEARRIIGELNNEEAPITKEELSKETDKDLNDILEHTKDILKDTKLDDTEKATIGALQETALEILETRRQENAAKQEAANLDTDEADVVEDVLDVPEGTVEAAPETTQEVAPEAAPETIAETTQEATQEATQEVTEDGTPIPAATPTPTPTPAQETAPEGPSALAKRLGVGSRKNLMGENEILGLRKRGNLRALRKGIQNTKSEEGLNKLIERIDATHDHLTNANDRANLQKLRGYVKDRLEVMKLDKQAQEAGANASTEAKIEAINKMAKNATKGNDHATISSNAAAMHDSNIPIASREQAAQNVADAILNIAGKNAPQGSRASILAATKAVIAASEAMDAKKKKWVEEGNALRNKAGFERMLEIHKTLYEQTRMASILGTGAIINGDKEVLGRQVAAINNAINEQDSKTNEAKHDRGEKLNNPQFEAFVQAELDFLRRVKEDLEAKAKAARIYDSKLFDSTFINPAPGVIPGAPKAEAIRLSNSAHLSLNNRGINNLIAFIGRRLAKGDAMIEEIVADLPLTPEEREALENVSKNTKVVKKVAKLPPIEEKIKRSIAKKLDAHARKNMEAFNNIADFIAAFSDADFKQIYNDKTILDSSEAQAPSKEAIEKATGAKHQEITDNDLAEMVEPDEGTTEDSPEYREKLKDAYLKLAEIVDKHNGDTAYTDAISKRWSMDNAKLVEKITELRDQINKEKMVNKPLLRSPDPINPFPFNNTTEAMLENSSMDGFFTIFKKKAALVFKLPNLFQTLLSDDPNIVESLFVGLNGNTRKALHDYFTTLQDLTADVIVADAKFVDWANNGQDGKFTGYVDMLKQLKADPNTVNPKGAFIRLLYSIDANGKVSMNPYAEQLAAAITVSATTWVQTMGASQSTSALDSAVAKILKIDEDSIISYKGVHPEGNVASYVTGSLGKNLAKTLGLSAVKENLSTEAYEQFITALGTYAMNKLIDAGILTSTNYSVKKAANTTNTAEFKKVKEKGNLTVISRGPNFDKLKDPQYSTQINNFLTKLTQNGHPSGMVYTSPAEDSRGKTEDYMAKSQKSAVGILKDQGVAPNLPMIKALLKAYNDPALREGFYRSLGIFMDSSGLAPILRESNEVRKKNVDAIMEQLKVIDSDPDSFPAIYQRLTVANTSGRITMSSALTWQGDKQLVRGILAGTSARIKFGDSKARGIQVGDGKTVQVTQEEAFKIAIARLYDVDKPGYLGQLNYINNMYGIEQDTPEKQNGELLDLKDMDDATREKVEKARTNAINAARYMKGEKLNKDELDAIFEEVKEHGHGTSGLQGMAAMGQYLQAKQGKNSRGAPYKQVDVTIYREDDGITNGLAIVVATAGFGSKGLGDFIKRATALGFEIEGVPSLQDLRSAQDFNNRKGLEDSYEQFVEPIQDAVGRFGTVPPTNVTDGAINKVMEKDVVKYIEYAKDANDNYILEPASTTGLVSPIAPAGHSDLISRLSELLGPSFQNGGDSAAKKKFLRDLVKWPLMMLIYGSGRDGLLEEVRKRLTDNLINEVNGHYQAYLNSDRTFKNLDTYQQKLVEINTHLKTLSRLYEDDLKYLRLTREETPRNYVEIRFPAEGDYAPEFHLVWAKSKKARQAHKEGGLPPSTHLTNPTDLANHLKGFDDILGKTLINNLENDFKTSRAILDDYNTVFKTTAQAYVSYFNALVKIRIADNVKEGKESYLTLAQEEEIRDELQKAFKGLPTVLTNALHEATVRAVTDEKTSDTKNPQKYKVTVPTNKGTSSATRSVENTLEAVSGQAHSFAIHSTDAAMVVAAVLKDKEVLQVYDGLIQSGLSNKGTRAANDAFSNLWRPKGKDGDAFSFIQGALESLFNAHVAMDTKATSEETRGEFGVAKQLALLSGTDITSTSGLSRYLELGENGVKYLVPIDFELAMIEAVTMPAQKAWLEFMQVFAKGANQYGDVFQGKTIKTQQEMEAAVATFQRIVDSQGKGYLSSEVMSAYEKAKEAMEDVQKYSDKTKWPLTFEAMAKLFENNTMYTLERIQSGAEMNDAGTFFKERSTSAQVERNAAKKEERKALIAEAKELFQQSLPLPPDRDLRGEMLSPVFQATFKIGIAEGLDSIFNDSKLSPSEKVTKAANYVKGMSALVQSTLSPSKTAKGKQQSPATRTSNFKIGSAKKQLLKHIQEAYTEQLDESEEILKENAFDAAKKVRKELLQDIEDNSVPTQEPSVESQDTAALEATNDANVDTVQPPVGPQEDSDTQFSRDPGYFEVDDKDNDTEILETIHNARSEQLGNIFNRFLGQSHNLSTEHQSHLSKVMEGLTTAFQNLGHQIGLVISRDLNEVTEAYGSVTTNGLLSNISVALPNSTSALSATSMSAAEVLSHEMTHPFWEYALRKDAGIGKEALRLFQTVSNHPNFDYTLFLDPDIQFPTETDKKIAQERFTYTFSKSKRPLEEFLTMALTNESFRKNLNKILSPTPAKKKSFWDGLQNLWTKVLNFVSGQTANYDTSSQSVKDGIDTLFLQAQSALNRGRSKNINDRMTARYEQVLKKVGSAGGKVVRSIIPDKLAQAVSIAAHKHGVPETLDGITTMIGKAIRKAANKRNDTMDIHSRNFFTDFLGDQKYVQDIGRFIEQGTTMIDEESRRQAEDFTRLLKSAFKRAPTRQEHRDMTYTIGKADLGSLLDYGADLSEVIDMLNSPAALEKYISRATNQLKGALKDNPSMLKAMQGHIAAYANFTINENQDKGIYLQNAHQIAKQVYKVFDPRIKLSDIDQSVIEAADVLMTLATLKEIPEATRKRVGKMFKDPDTANGMYTTLATQNAYRTQSLVAFAGQEYLMTKGHVTDLTNKDKDVILSAVTDEQALRQQGYILAKTMNMAAGTIDRKAVRVGVYVRNFSARSAKSNSALYAVQNSRVGESIAEILAATQVGQNAGVVEANLKEVVRRNQQMLDNETKRMAQGLKVTPNSTAGLMPVPTRTNEAINWRSQAIDTKFKETFLDKGYDYIEAISTGMAHLKYRDNVPDHNERVINYLQEEAAKYDQEPEAFVRLSFDDPQIVNEIRQLDPKSRKMLDAAFPNKVFVARKSQIGNVLGYRKFSPMELKKHQSLPAGQQTKWDKFYGIVNDSLFKALANKLAGHYHYLHTNVVKEITKIIVIRGGEVIWNNILSNFYISRIIGMSNTPETIKKVAEGWKGAVDYGNLQTELGNIKAELSVEKAKGAGADKAKIARMERNVGATKNALEAHPMHRFKRMGFLSTVNNDLSESVAVNETKQGPIRAKFSKFLNSGPLGRAVKEAFGTEDSTSFRFLRDTMIYSEFGFKYAYYDFLTKTRPDMPEAERIRRVDYIFFNYAIASSKPVEAAESAGFVLFPKFTLKAQRANVLTMTEDPARFVAEMTIKNILMPGISGLEDAFFLGGGSIMSIMNNPYADLPDVLKPTVALAGAKLLGVDV